MMKLFGRRRHRTQALSYAAMSIQSEEDDDNLETKCLLAADGILSTESPPPPPPPKRQQRKKLRASWSIFWKACRRNVGRIRKTHKVDRNVVGNSYSTATSSPPTSMVVPRELDESSLASVPSPPSRREGQHRPMYYIISEVGSVSMRAEEQMMGGLATERPPLDQWHDEEDEQGPQRGRRLRSCTRLGRLSLSRCFHRLAVNVDSNHYNEETKEIETIPFSLDEGDDEISSFPDDETLVSLLSEDEPPPPPVARTKFPLDFQVCSRERTGRTHVPGEVKVAPFPSQCRLIEGSAESLSLHSSIGEDDYCSDEEGRDSRDDSNSNGQLPTTRECVQLLFPPPILPFRKMDPIQGPSHVLGVVFPHPNAKEEPEHETLGIHSAHPLWVERKKNDIWEQVVDTEPFTLEDEELLLRPSPIQVESWTGGNMWMDEPSSSSTHSIRQEESIPFKDESPEPMDWTRKIYQPIFRIAQEITTCGQLGDTQFEEAPFDEVQDDMNYRIPLDEVTNTVYTARQSKPSVRPLKPNPKDSPSFATWMRDFGSNVARNPLWDDFLQTN